MPGATPRDGCDWGTPIAPQDRGFSGGRSRHYGRRNRVRPLLTEGAIRPANTERCGAPTKSTGCDSGCDRGALTESHAGAANWVTFRFARTTRGSRSPGRHRPRPGPCSVRCSLIVWQPQNLDQAALDRFLTVADGDGVVDVAANTEPADLGRAETARRGGHPTLRFWTGMPSCIAMWRRSA